MSRWQYRSYLVPVLCMLMTCLSSSVIGQNLDPKPRDRGSGISSSIFGTYIDKHQLVIYPFFSYIIDHDQEYSPAQLGLGPDDTYLGKYKASEGIIFVGYGISNRFALELEASYIAVTFDKSIDDNSGFPSRIEESGFADFEGQLRVRIANESAGRPEVFGFLEITPPFQRNRKLIGNEDWDFKPGIGIVKGYSWGTITFRSTIEYTRTDSSLNVGETALEFIRRFSPKWQFYCGIEGGEGGGPDEWVLTPGINWQISQNLYVRCYSAIGLFPKATDWAPELGLLYSLPLNKME